MNRIRIAILALTLAIAGACTAAAEPIPQDPQGEPPVEQSTTTTSKVSTCDRVREAFLTGTVADQTAALQALKADTTADGTAREYADYWLNRDKGDPSMREMDKSLIQMYCTL